ncbi:MAG TPA: site-2 protease family protein [Actinomycetota bacterium]
MRREPKKAARTRGPANTPARGTLAGSVRDGGPVFGRTWKIATIGGIPISVDASWFLLGVLILYSMAVTYGDKLGSGTALAIGAFGAVLFMGSILGHELAHAVVARLRKLPVSGIRLFMFGGATYIRGEDSPGDEFLTTVVGPLTSVAIGLALLAASTIHGLGGPIHDVTRYVGALNVFLGVANLVPGFPLDGGRILHAAIWKLTGSEGRATTIAAWTGIVVWGAAIAYGVIRLSGDDFGFGLWIVLVGSMMLQGARATLQRQKVFKVLERGTVAEAMGAPPEAIPAGTSLSEAYDRFLRGHEHETFPVTDDFDRMIGVLTFESASAIGRDEPLRPVRDAMLPAGEIVTVGLDDRLDQVVNRMANTRLPAVVMQDGRIVGQIALPDIDRWLRGRILR